MLAFDHVIVPVRDLEAAASRFEREYGLASLPGGRHSGHGTGNRIIPLGPDYIELMAVVDPQEASQSPLGRWVAERSAREEGPAGLCLRTDDLAGAARRLGLERVAMSRRRPDGAVIGWELAGLEAMVSSGLPFFIAWHVDPADHPGRAAADHAIEPVGIAWVELAGDRSDWQARLGPNDLDLRSVGGPAGVRRVGIAAAGGVVVVG